MGLRLEGNDTRAQRCECRASVSEMSTDVENQIPRAHERRIEFPETLLAPGPPIDGDRTKDAEPLRYRRDVRPPNGGHMRANTGFRSII